MRGRPGMVLNNDDMMRDAALAGLGVALLPVFVAGAALRAGTLRVTDVGVAAERDYIYMAHADGRHSSAKLCALGAWRREAFGDPPHREAGCSGCR